MACPAVTSVVCPAPTRVAASTTPTPQTTVTHKAKEPVQPSPSNAERITGGDQAAQFFRDNSGQKSQSRTYGDDVTEHGYNMQQQEPIGRAGSQLHFGWEEIVEHTVPQEAGFEKYRPRARRAKFRRTSRLDHSPCIPAVELAYALTKAQELAKAVDLPKRARFMETNRLIPIYWDHRDGNARIFIPNPNSEELLIDDCYNLPIVARAVAIKFALHRWDDFLHLGSMPGESELEQYEYCNTNDARQEVLREINGEADQYLLKAAACSSLLCGATSTAPRCPSDRWMLDSGCGHDLVCEKDIPQLLFQLVQEAQT